MASLAEAKAKMLEEDLAGREIGNSLVLDAFASVPREEFVPEDYRDWAYADTPLEIGEGQTISQPFTVAYMTQLLDPQPDDIILEIGTGSGYQAAILSGLVKKVYTVERLKSLAKKARKVLKKLGYENIEVVVRDGSKGLPKYAPYDGIIVTAAAPYVPPPLLDQLKVGGRLVAPVGSGLFQDMIKITKTKEGLEEETHPAFTFVPLIGKYGFSTKNG